MGTYLLGCLTLFLSLVPSLPGAHAAPASATFEDWIARLHADCSSLNDCKVQGVRVEVLLDHKTQENRPPEPLYKQLRVAARERAYLWSDTILEGDYYAAGYTRLDRVEEISDSRGVVGYRIVYSEAAWETGRCRFNPENPHNTLQGCPAGRISEASFVSLDWKEHFRDETQIATFIALAK